MTMKKKITLSVEEEALATIDEMAQRAGYDRSAFFVYLAGNAQTENERRVILPKNLTSKDDMAKFLGIGPLSKEYSLFEDRIYEARVYDPNKVRNGF